MLLLSLPSKWPLHCTRDIDMLTLFGSEFTLYKLLILTYAYFQFGTWHMANRYSPQHLECIFHPNNNVAGARGRRMTGSSSLVVNGQVSTARRTPSRPWSLCLSPLCVLSQAFYLCSICKVYHRSRTQSPRLSNPSTQGWLSDYIMPQRRSLQVP